MGSRLLGVHGQVQREGDVIHVIAERLTDLSSMLSKLGDQQCLSRFGSTAAMDRRMVGSARRQARASGSTRYLYFVASSRRDQREGEEFPVARAQAQRRKPPNPR